MYLRIAMKNFCLQNSPSTYATNAVSRDFFSTFLRKLRCQKTSKFALRAKTQGNFCPKTQSGGSFRSFSRYWKKLYSRAGSHSQYSSKKLLILKICPGLIDWDTLQPYINGKNWYILRLSKFPAITYVLAPHARIFFRKSMNIHDFISAMITWPPCRN